MTTEQALRDALVMAQSYIAVRCGTPDPEDPHADRILIEIQQQIDAALSQPQAAPADGETLNAPSDDDSMFTIHECLRLADVWSQCDLDAAPQWRTVVYVLAREVRKMLSAPSVAEPRSDQFEAGWKAGYKHGAWATKHPSDQAAPRAEPVAWGEVHKDGIYSTKFNVRLATLSAGVSVQEGTKLYTSQEQKDVL